MHCIVRFESKYLNIILGGNLEKQFTKKLVKGKRLNES